MALKANEVIWLRRTVLPQGSQGPDGACPPAPPLLAGAMCGVRNDSCSRKHKYARTAHGMASESLSTGVDLFFAREFCFFKQEHGPPRGSKQAKTDVLLTTVLGPLR